MKNIKKVALGLVLASSIDCITAVAAPMDISNHWAMSDIIYLEREGIIPTYSDNRFRPDYEITLGEYLYSINSLLDFNGIKQNDPNDTVTREDAIRILGLALGMENQLPKSLYNFKDTNEICNSCIIYANLLYEKGYISGDENGYFNPKKNMTRAEVAGLLSHVKRDIDGYSNNIQYGNNHLKMGTYLSIDGARMERKVLMDRGYTNTMIVKFKGQNTYTVLVENSLNEYDARNFQIRLNNEGIKTEVIGTTFTNLDIVEQAKQNQNITRDKNSININQNNSIYTTGYSVQNGVFSTYDSAEEQRKKLYNKGFKNAFIVSSMGDSRYYLLVDSGLTKESADELRVRLISNGFDSFSTSKVFKIEEKNDMNIVNYKDNPLDNKNNNLKLEKINLGYYIQTGVYSSYEGAKNDYNNLKSKGFNDAFIFKDGTKYYVVGKAYLNENLSKDYLRKIQLSSSNGIIKSNKTINTNQIIKK